MKKFIVLMLVVGLFVGGYVYKKDAALDYYYRNILNAGVIELDITGMFSQVSADKITEKLTGMEDVLYVVVRYGDQNGICYVRDGKVGFDDLKKAVDGLGYLVIDPDAEPDTITVEGFQVKY